MTLPKVLLVSSECWAGLRASSLAFFLFQDISLSFSGDSFVSRKEPNRYGCAIFGILFGMCEAFR